MHIQTMRRGSLGMISVPNAPLPEIENNRLESPSTSARETGPDMPSIAGVLTLAISSAQPQSDALRSQKEAILSEAQSFGQLVDKFLERARAEEREAAVARLNEIKALGREQEATCARISQELMQAGVEFNQARDTKEKRIEAVRVAKYQREHMSRWASDAEVARADRKLAECKASAQKAVHAEAAALQEMNRIQGLLAEAQANLNLLVAEEVRTRHVINGVRAYLDPETGLATVPGLPV